MKRLYKIKTHSPYIPGVVGKEIRLTFRERLAILFHSGITIELYSAQAWRDFLHKELDEDGGDAE